jgi:DNA-binding NarL/FixJ family response regulator
MVKILVADPQLHVRRALRVLLERQAGARVIDEVSSGDELEIHITRSRPDVLILDLDLPQFQPETGLMTLRRHHPHMLMIVWSGRDENRCLAMAAGADLFIAKNKPPDELLAALQQHAFC